MELHRKTSYRVVLGRVLEEGFSFSETLSRGVMDCWCKYLGFVKGSTVARLKIRFNGGTRYSEVVSLNHM